MPPFFDKVAENRLYGACKYRFGLQKVVRIQKYFFILKKYDVSAFYCTFNRLHIFKIGDATPDQIFVSRAS